MMHVEYVQPEFTERNILIYSRSSNQAERQMATGLQSTPKASAACSSWWEICLRARLRVINRSCIRQGRAAGREEHQAELFAAQFKPRLKALPEPWPQSAIGGHTVIKRHVVKNGNESCIHTPCATRQPVMGQRGAQGWNS